MDRTRKEDRKANAIMFSQTCNNFSGKFMAIHVRREKNRCQFVYYPSNFSGGLVIAESSGLGVGGCWIELVSFIRGGIPQITFHEEGFYEWLSTVMKMKCVYHDPAVFIFDIS